MFSVGREAYQATMSHLFDTKNLIKISMLRRNISKGIEVLRETLKEIPWPSNSTR